MTISRRQFLCAASSSLLATSALGRLQRGTGANKRVLVIGGGPAGLCAAYELELAGCSVSVFEARPIPGGRILSIRQPFADGQYAEAGAMVLGSDVITRYVDEFDLPTAPVDFGTALSGPYFLRGKLVEQDLEGRFEWPTDVSREEQGLSRNALLNRYWRSPSRELKGELTSRGFPYRSLEELDKVSFAQFLRDQGASESAIEIISLGYYDQVGDGPESYSALSVFAESALFADLDWSRGPFQIKGGNDRLPQAFADRLSKSVNYNARVVAARQDEHGVRLTVETTDGKHQVDGDLIVCAAPLHLLSQIDFGSALSTKRQDAFSRIDCTSITRVFLQFTERFWEAAGRHPGARTDLTIQSIVPTTMTQPGPRGILESFSGGDNARVLGELTDETLINRVLAELSTIHPEAREFFETGAVVRWDDEPGIRGCQAFYRPGQMHQMFPMLASPEGRIHFAGDHIGGAPGYTLSALLSAQQAVRQILAA